MYKFTLQTVKFKQSLLASTCLLVSSLACGQETSPVFDNFFEVSKGIGKQIEKSISNSDRISLFLHEVVLSEELTKQPRVVEIEVTFNDRKGGSSVYSTVSRSLLKPEKQKTSINSNYSIIVSSEPLLDIKNIEVSFNLRPIDEANEQLFDTLSGLLQIATPDNPAIDILREVIPRPKGQVELPKLTSKFIVPSNFSHAQELKNKGYAIFEPDIPMSVAFSIDEATMSSNLLKNAINLVIGEKIYKDTRNISGYVKVIPTKVERNKIEPRLLGKMNASFKYLISSEKEKFTLARKLYNDALAMVNSYYPSTDTRLTSERDACLAYLYLLNIYIEYENGRADELAPRFANWVATHQDPFLFSGIDTYYVSDFYGNKDAVLLFPKLLDNNALSQLLHMQKRFHNSMKSLKGTPNYLSLVDSVSHETSSGSLANRN
ncbi:hypothetical protein [Vibrio sp. 10N.237.312.B06]|uniref:hypothetical protein n=1 Tax=Vibrio sp. 10N.237.312.B06 TaxID=3229974 RepID=UPI003551B5F4